MKAASLDIDAAFDAAVSRRKEKRRRDAEAEAEAEAEARGKDEERKARKANGGKDRARRFDGKHVAGANEDEGMPDYVNSLKGVTERKRTQEGYRIFSERELGVFDYQRKNAGFTKLCPFDCDCCF